MIKRVAAAATNWFLPGLGYLIIGHKPLLSLAWIVGMVGLTWVELSVQSAAPDLYWPMFASVLVINTAFAVDAWQRSGEDTSVAPALA